MEKIIASIITIGDELLIGQVIDTNSAWIAQELNKIGIWVKQRVAVGDSKNEIIRALNEESRDTHIIIITGGLGPTADDITKPVLCEYFGGKLVVNEDVLEHVKYLFEQVFRRPVIERNLKQAEVPDVCTVLHNDRGTAPGMWFEKEGKVFVSLPGVPHEMKGMMTTRSVAPAATGIHNAFIAHRTLLTAGVGESLLAETIQIGKNSFPHISSWPIYRIMAWYGCASPGVSANKEQLEKELNTEFAQLKILVQQWLVTDGDKTPADGVEPNCCGQKTKHVYCGKLYGWVYCTSYNCHPGASNIL